MPYRPTPKTEARKAAMRHRLMKAASDLFASQGYEQTTLKEIVSAAETSIGNCYFYFLNKEAILLAISEDLRNEIAWKVDAAIAGKPIGPDLLATAVYVGTMAVLENAEVARFALSDGAHPAIRPLTIATFTARVEVALRSAPSIFLSWPEATVPLASSAWHGASSHVLEAAINGRITEPAERIALFLARWNLQALGLPHESVKASLQQIIAQFDLTLDASKIDV